MIVRVNPVWDCFIFQLVTICFRKLRFTTGPYGKIKKISYVVERNGQKCGHPDVHMQCIRGIYAYFLKHDIFKLLLSPQLLAYSNGTFTE